MIAYGHFLFFLQYFPERFQAGIHHMGTGGKTDDLPSPVPGACFAIT
jgi:hypothetical protein